jgi:hypothetical protein
MQNVSILVGAFFFEVEEVANLLDLAEISIRDEGSI